MKTCDLDKKIPQIAKNETEIIRIKQEVSALPTSHKLYISDARNLSFLDDNSIHLIITSPPYWNLKKYNDNTNQLGHINDYDLFLDQLDKVWKECYRVLHKGGRLIVVVGDVLLSRKKFGRHKVVPLHADIQIRCDKMGFDNLAPIFWYKIANATFEVEGNSKFLGKPYEPNGIIKHDIEYILMLRKPGGYRKPTNEQRRLSVISDKEFDEWYRQIWTLNGTSTKNHPAPFPEELARRLIRMFSFAGDTVLDPFAGSGTTMVAAMDAGRNSIGIELDKNYANFSYNRLNKKIGLFNSDRIKLAIEEMTDE